MENIISLVNKFCKGEYDPDTNDTSWKNAFEYISRNHHRLVFAKDKIHTLWTVNGGHLRRKIRDDNLIVKVLSLTLPGYIGDGLTLYRGECRFLYKANLIGFCWTPDITVASMFASGLNAIESGGVLLKAFAPRAAIFASLNKHSSEQMQEFEYTCNPHLLINIELIKVFQKNG